MKTDVLNKYFTSVFTQDTATPPPPIQGPPFPNITITYCYKLQWGCTAFSHTGCAQSNRSRPYSITSAERDIFRNSTSLTLIFQASLHQCSIPSNWKEAFITPLFKKGDHNLPTNYCSVSPVSLTSICCKLLEHIIYSHNYILTP